MLQKLGEVLQKLGEKKFLCYKNWVNDFLNIFVAKK